jgi:hypothetical protein
VKDDKQALIQLNKAIGDAENNGNRKFLESILAPRLAFQRSNPLRTIDDQVAYLQKVETGGDRVTREIEPGDVDVYGDRAIVRCIVSTGNGGFHNIRLFVRREGGWKLLAWANEPWPPTNPD